MAFIKLNYPNTFSSSFLNPFWELPTDHFNVLFFDLISLSALIGLLRMNLFEVRNSSSALCCGSCLYKGGYDIVYLLIDDNINNTDSVLFYRTFYWCFCQTIWTFFKIFRRYPLIDFQFCVCKLWYCDCLTIIAVSLYLNFFGGEGSHGQFCFARFRDLEKVVLWFLLNKCNFL